MLAKALEAGARYGDVMRRKRMSPQAPYLGGVVSALFVSPSDYRITLQRHLGKFLFLDRLIWGGTPHYPTSSQINTQHTPQHNLFMKPALQFSKTLYYKL